MSEEKTDFFAQPQGAAVFKHGAFKRYVPKFAGKLGSTSHGSRIVVCDGYAGRGRYDDGTPGSPLIVAEIAATMTWRQIELICVEKDEEAADQLRKELAPYGIPYKVLCGTFEEHIDDVLAFAGDSPLLAFLDPFGMGAPMEKLKGLLSRDPAGGFHMGPPTEILMNFSFPGLRRNAGHLTSSATNDRYLAARATILDRVDGWMGGDWWREQWAQDKETEEARELVLRTIVYEYLRRLAGGRAWHVSPATDRWGGPAAYLLALFTQNEHGLWEFNDSLSYAREDFYKYTHRDQLPFDPFSAWGDEWAMHIAGNIEAELGKGAVRIRGALGRVLGDTLGWAREKHIRAAIKKLHAEGKTPSDGKGKLFGSTVLPRR